jgi:hypothetical protein
MRIKTGIVSSLLFALLASASPALANAINSANADLGCSGSTIVVTGINLEQGDSFVVLFTINFTPPSGPVTTVSGSMPVTQDAMGNFTTTIDLPAAPAGTSEVEGTIELFDNTTMTTDQGPVPVDFGSLTCSAPSGGCPATIGFWKNSKKHPFPPIVQASGLTIGGVHYTAKQLLTILSNNGGNAVAILGKQLVGALLNEAAGAMHNVTADAAIMDAEALLQSNSLNLLTSNVAPSSTLGGQLLLDEVILDNYNSADFGTCSEGSGLTLGK